MKERHWNSLLAALRHGRCVLVLGPEIPVGHKAIASTGETTVTFAGELAGAIASELAADDRSPRGSTLAALAQQYEDNDDFGGPALRAKAARFFRSLDYIPSSFHEKLAGLPFRVVLSICQDDLFGQALSARGKSPETYRYHVRGDKRENSECPVPESPVRPVLFHLFGRATEPASLVLSENDILDFLIGIVSENPPLPNSLLRVLRRPGQSFLFVGFGIRYWHLRVVLKIILRALDVGRSASAVAAESLAGLAQADRDDTILYYQRGMRVEVEDCALEAFLNELATRLDSDAAEHPMRPAIIGHVPRVFISYAHENEGLAVRVHDILRDAQFDVWFDRSSLVGGENWDQHIESELRTTDFVIVLYTQEFSRKIDSYVNKEVAFAVRRARSVRGSFLIPLRTDEIAAEDRVRELELYQEMPLDTANFDEDMAKVISLMRREYQRRNR